MCEEGKEVEAAKVQDKVCRERLKNMYSEARIQCVISYHHEVLGQKVTKKQAREILKNKNKKSLPKVCLDSSRQSPPLPRASLAGFRQRLFF